MLLTFSLAVLQLIKKNQSDPLEQLQSKLVLHAFLYDNDVLRTSERQLRENQTLLLEVSAD